MTMLNGTVKRSISDIIDAINRAIHIRGSVSALAEVMGVCRQTIYLWRSSGLVPLEFASKIFVATDGEVKITEVCRPKDIFFATKLEKLFIKVYRRRKDYGTSKKSKRGKKEKILNQNSY